MFPKLGEQLMMSYTSNDQESESILVRHIYHTDRYILWAKLIMCNNTEVSIYLEYCGLYHQFGKTIALEIRGNHVIYKFLETSF